MDDLPTELLERLHADLNSPADSNLEQLAGVVVTLLDGLIGAELALRAARVKAEKAAS